MWQNLVRVRRRDGSAYLAWVLPKSNPLPQQVETLLLHGRKGRKKVDRNTYLVQEGDGSVSLILHQTDVVHYYPDKLVLRTGGWHTMTTRDRIELGLRLAHIGGSISTTGRGVGGPWLYTATDGQRFPFDEGLALDYAGKVLNARPGGEKPEDTAISESIEHYLKLLRRKLIDVSWDPGTDETRWTGDLKEAIDRDMFPYSLIMQAMEDTGYRTDFYGDILQDPNKRGQFDDTFVRAVRRYLRKHMLSFAH